MSLDLMVTNCIMLINDYVVLMNSLYSCSTALSGDILYK